MIKEFKEFIARGNVLDMAVGIVVGGAFTAIVNSLVNDIIMPLVGLIIGGVNFSDLKIVIKAATDEAAEVAFCYGNFLQAVINFLLIAFAVFIMIKAINKMREASDKAAAKLGVKKEEKEE